jgi:hypothetical protein
MASGLKYPAAMSTTRRLAPVLLFAALTLCSVDTHAQGKLVTRAVSSVKSKLAARKAVRVAKADFKSFLAEGQNKDLATFYTGARDESGVNNYRFLRATTFTIGALYAGVGALSKDLIATGIGLNSVAMSQGVNGSIAKLERSVRDRVVGHSTANVPAKRLAMWQNAGIVSAQ